MNWSFLSRRSVRLLAWAGLPVLILAVVVQVTGYGIDLLLLAAAGLALLAFERSVGDWVAEWFGPVAAAAIFVAIAVALCWYFLSSSLGRPQTDRFFREAERRGYRTAYYRTARSSADTPPPSPDITREAQPVATGGASPTSRSSSADQSAGPSRSGRDRPEAAPAPAAPSADSERTARGLSRVARPFFRRRPGDPLATAVSVDISPPTVEVARRAHITATVVTEATPVTSGTVEFTINGMGAGRVLLNSQGVASTTFQTHIPGSYDVRAHFTGSSDYASSTGRASLSVVTRR